jgi:hypothetical protein
MEIIVKNRQQDKIPQADKVLHSPPYRNRSGAWGRVEKTYSGDHSADVFLDTGVYLKRCPVRSNEWVVSGDEYTSGERDLPPIGAWVFVLMPYNTTYDGCFVLCSGFVANDKPQKETFMEEDKEKSRKRITPGNWKELYDCATGTRETVSPDGKTSLKIDYGTAAETKDKPELHLVLFERTTLDFIAEDNAKLSLFDGDIVVEHKAGDNVKLTIFDTELTIKVGEVSIKPKKSTIEVDGDATIKTSGKTTIEADGDAIVKGANVTVEAALKAEVKGAQVVIDGSVIPGNGPFCALPNCLFTGAPHGGDTAAGG